jgi:hypothetical protein
MAASLLLYVEANGHQQLWIVPEVERLRADHLISLRGGGVLVLHERPQPLVRELLVLQRLRHRLYGAHWADNRTKTKSTTARLGNLIASYTTVRTHTHTVRRTQPRSPGRMSTRHKLELSMA